jgi:hypothetical protein
MEFEHDLGNSHMNDDNRREVTDKDVNLIWERIRGVIEEPVKEDQPEVVRNYVIMSRDLLSGKANPIKPDSPLFGLQVFMDVMEAHAINNLPQEDLRHLIYRAEDAYGIDLELIQTQLAHQIDLSWEPGRYGRFSNISLDRAMEMGLKLGIFKEERMR